MNRFVLALAAAVASVSSVSFAATEGPGTTQFIQPARTAARIDTDGRMDEPAWREAPVFDGFVQRFPVAGAPPSERTELRVLYDDQNLYIAVRCFDSKPEAISRRLARRDSTPFSDAVQVMIDPAHDHRTAYLFYLNAGGVQGDGLFYDDRYYTSEWDGVWDGAVSVDDQGWTAEYLIPLGVLRFPAAEVQTWGFGARRDIARKNEELDSVKNPRHSNANVSRFGHLTGMTGLAAKRAVELIPYLKVSAALTPQYAGDYTRPTPRLLNPAADVGLDLKTALTSDLDLNATLNPDFAQVEADQLLQNLTTFELRFPEKRPFFTQGMELFQPVGAGEGQNQALFYSRRVGLGLPILGAAKVTGSVAQGVEVGVLDAVVLSPSQGEVDEDNPDRRFQFHPERPFHFGLNSELPAVAPAPTNFLAAVTRASVGKNSYVGAMVTSAVPLADECTPEEAAAAVRPAECRVHGGNAAAVRWDLKTPDSQYGVLGQVVGSQVVGGIPERQLEDGTVLRHNSLGAGGLLRAGKLGGEGLRWDVGYDYASPSLFLRPTGFLRTQNEHALRGAVRWNDQDGVGPFKSLFAMLQATTRRSADGRFIGRGDSLYGNLQLQLPSFDSVGIEAGAEFNQSDLREIGWCLTNSDCPGATGIPMQKANGGWIALFGDTNANRPLFLNGFLAVGFHENPVRPLYTGWGGNLTLTWRPTDALESSLQVANDMTIWGPQYVDTLDSASRRFLFGDLYSQFLSVTFRQQVMITPRLSVQAYAQLFSELAEFGQMFEGQSDAARRAIRFSELLPVTAPFDPTYQYAAMNVNVVLRWEYRLGSTLFVVYTRSQDNFRTGGDTPRTVLPQRLFAGPATDSFQVKWSYYWSV